MEKNTHEQELSTEVLRLNDGFICRTLFCRRTGKAAG